MTYGWMPTLNAFLNAVTAGFLVAGRAQIKRGRRDRHKRLMLMALTTSVLFLISYLFYHYQVGTVKYQHYGWTRPVYFIILISHTILAGGMVPFIVAAVYFAFKGRFESHKRITVWLWPVWIYVSLTGIAVYLMLYRV